MSFSPLTEYLDSLPGIGIPGVDCIVQQGHETVYRHYAGFSDRDARIPMTGEERFYINSCTKPVVCVAALQLYEKGKFLLTDPLGNYLPEFWEMTITRKLPNGETVLEKAQNPIRIVDLFTMSSGFVKYLSAESIQRVKKETSGRAPTREVIRAVAEIPLAYEPGTRWSYCTVAHDILGGLIEELTGRTFGAYLQENIFQPLGMTRTGFQVPDDLMAQYERIDATGEIIPIGKTHKYILGTEYESGGAGLVSCVDDYIKFASALANGGYGESGERILSSATIDLMRTNHLTARQMPTFDWEEMLGYGYGLGVRTLIDPAAGGSNSTAGEFGWFGSAGSYLLIDPERKLSMFYAQHVRENRSGPSKPRLRNSRMRNILYGCLE